LIFKVSQLLNSGVKINHNHQLTIMDKEQLMELFNGLKIILNMNGFKNQLKLKKNYDFF
jgi:hypothetical protein